MLASKDVVLVDEGTGYISDDSSFYGEEATKTELTRNARSPNRTTPVYWFNHSSFIASINAHKMDPKITRGIQPEDIVISETADSSTPDNFLVAKSAISASEPRAPRYLKRKAMEAERVSRLGPSNVEPKLYNPHEGEESARQLSETVTAFLSRLPPLTTTIAGSGPWIWIANPYHQACVTSQDWAGFMTASEKLINEFETQKTAIEKSLKGQPRGTITRKITPLRKVLEREIFGNAKTRGCTAGKWMLFPTGQNINNTWKLVAEGVASGELGIAAKVATHDGSNDREGRLVCVYTKDFSDPEDVRRVLVRLVELGLVKRKGPMGEQRGVYYKCDAYTNLGIMGGNEWSIKPSLYSSNEILEKGESWSLANGCG